MVKTLEEVTAEWEAEGDVFYAALGRALSRWASVEWALFQIYMIAAGTPDSAVAMASFFSVLSFHSKLRMVDAAISVRFNGHAVRGEWQKLYNKLPHKAEIRNNIAHAPSTFDSMRRKGTRYFIDVGVYNPALHPSVTGKARTKYYTADLKGLEAGFTNLIAKDCFHVELCVVEALNDEREAAAKRTGLRPKPHG